MKLLIKTKFLFTACLIAVLMVISGQAVLSAFLFPQVLAEEETITSVLFHETKIEDDLKSLGINTSVYSKNKEADASVINVTEYCYSTNTEIASTYYNLYFYVYNPKGAEILQSSNNNIQLDISFDENGNPVPNGWQHHILYVCDYTDNFLFYKFRLLSPTPVLSFANSYAYYNDGARKYSISGITLTYNDTETGGLKQIEYLVDTSFTYTGFSKGCGNEPESTLQCVVNGLETINLKVKDSTWRSPWSINNDENIYNSLSTVYFGIPKRYLEKFQLLKSIKAEWYEYKTKPIFATTEKSFVDTMKQYIGIDLQTVEKRPKWSVLFDIDYWGPKYDYEFNQVYNDAVNLPITGPYDTTYGYSDDYKELTTLYYLFNVLNNDNSHTYDISSAQLINYMNDYTAGKYNFNKNGELIVDLDGKPIPKENLELTGQFSKDLFESYEDEDVKKIVEKNYNEIVSLIEYNENRNLWDILLGLNETDEIKLSPFVVIDSIPEDMTVEEFEKKYYIDDDSSTGGDFNNSSSVLQDCRDYLTEGLYPVLFRFANRPYFLSQAYYDYVDSDSGSYYNFSSLDGYVAQETIFLNFDILSLTFQKNNGEEVIIPVVSNPINIIAGLVAPPGINISNKDIWALLKLILGLIIFVIIIIVCWPVLGPILSWFIKIIGTCFKYLFQAVWWIITSPLRLFKWLFSDKPKK